MPASHRKSKTDQAPDCAGAPVTGSDLLALGWTAGPALGRALAHVNREGLRGEALAAWSEANRPAPVVRVPLQTAPDYAFNIEAESEEEAVNVADVRETMDALMRTPTLRAGAVMPDACPAGPVGTIPVGGVATAENAIHPGMHSADICCSVMISVYQDADPKALLDAMHAATHFGPGGRPMARRFATPADLMEAFRANDFLNDRKILDAAESHLGTQGDGNHFAFVGRSKATSATCLVTHHGSRGPGAGLYSRGMKAAEIWRKRLSPETLKQNAWIPADSDEGEAYWEALQLIRAWTKVNHEALHDAASTGFVVADRFWNEHNFVFREGDLFHHAKGATPVGAGLQPDAGAAQIVPLNMAEPVLLVRSRDGAGDVGLGFAPHGAGRNRSRTAHRRSLQGRTDAEVFAEETAGLDARFYCGEIDVSELPSAYKSAANVRDQMDRFGIADVVDEIEPFGSIMAGDWERNAPWRRKAEAKRAARVAEGGM